MLTCNFENRGKAPLYSVLYRSIREDILKGKLKPDEKLPSKRSLAQHLKISVVTVENAYAQLVLEGYVYSKEKKGYFVCSVQELKPNPPKNAPTIHENVNESREYFGDFRTNKICSERFPFSIWAKLMREVLSEEDKALLEATPYNGVFELRSAIAEYLYRFRGMSVSPDQILIGAGTEYLYSMIIRLIGEDNVFALENPGYKKIAKIYNSNGAKCEFISMDNKGLSIGELENSKANVVHISPAHHFPTGIVIPIGRRYELLNWANQKDGRYIIEDDYDSEFRFSGRPVQTLQSIDVSQKVIYINTFAKTIAPSMRISYMILPQHLMDIYNKKLSFFSCTVPSFEQYTLAKFISKGFFEQHINRMRTFYKNQRDLVIRTLKSSSINNKITILEEYAGLHFLIKLETDKSDDEIVKMASDAGIKISCLSEYFYNQDMKRSGTIIINYSGISSERIKESVEILSDVLSKC